MTLTDFLLARIAEDEAITARADGSVWRPPADFYPMGAFEGGHLVSMSAPRALVECAVKRRIVALHGSPMVVDVREHGPAVFCDVCDDGYPCATIRLLALPYADHPEFREEWRP